MCSRMRENGNIVIDISAKQMSASHLIGEANPAIRKHINDAPGTPETCFSLFLLSNGAPIYVANQNNSPIPQNRIEIPQTAVI